MTDLYTILSIIQLIFIIASGIAVVSFLWLYRKSWNINSPFSRFVVILNVSLILLVLIAISSRLDLFSGIVFEFVRTTVLGLICFSLFYQLALLTNTYKKYRRDKGKNVS